MTAPTVPEMKDGLLPCPFCGGAGRDCFNGDVPFPMYWVLCEKCHASPGDRSSREEAAAAWNTRVALKALLDHLKLMQRAATAYLLPEDYRDREGKVTLQGDHNNTDQWKQGQRGFRAEAFANDMLYLLDGPEQRAAEATARATIAATQQATGEGATKGTRWAMEQAREVLSRLQYANTAKDFDESRVMGVAILDAALASQQAVSPPEGVGWRPIETHDGSKAPVLLWFPDFEPVGTVIGYFRAPAADCYYPGQWVDDLNSEPFEVGKGEVFPTHWMPLPPAPDASQDQGSLAPARPHRNAADGGSSNEEVG